MTDFTKDFIINSIWFCSCIASSLIWSDAVIPRWVKNHKVPLKWIGLALFIIIIGFIIKFRHEN